MIGFPIWRPYNAYVGLKLDAWIPHVASTQGAEQPAWTVFGSGTPFRPRRFHPIFGSVALGAFSRHTALCVCVIWESHVSVCVCVFVCVLVFVIVVVCVGLCLLFVIWDKSLQRAQAVVAT